MKILRNPITAIAVIVVALVLAAGSGAVAGSLITSKQIKDDTIKSVDIKDNAVQMPDVSRLVRSRLMAVPWKANQRDMTRAEFKLRELEARLEDVEGDNRRDWEANGSSSVDVDTVHLRTTAPGEHTSVETQNLDIPVQAGDVISFRLSLSDGAQCTAGAPRMFVETQGVYTNSFDDDNGNVRPDSCGGDDGVVTFPVPKNGRIGAAGFAYDNGIPGVARIDQVTINGDELTFN